MVVKGRGANNEEKVGMSARNGMVAAALLLVLVLQAGCGYRAISHTRIDTAWRTLAVTPLENETTTFEVEQILTRALIRAFVESTSLQVISDASRADAVVRGSVFSLDASPVTFGEGAFASTFQVTLFARLEVRERETEKVIFSNEQFVFREQYVLNQDVENFFSELNPALERIGRDFAWSVVTSLLESL